MPTELTLLIVLLRADKRTTENTRWYCPAFDEALNPVGLDIVYKNKWRSLLCKSAQTL